MKSEVNGTTFRIRLSEEMKVWLFKESDQTGKTVSQIIREAVMEKMNSE